MEHRWGKRTTLRLAVRLVTASESSAPGILRNISASGAFIETIGRFPLLTSVRVEFPDSASFAAFVVRRSSKGLGVEWSEAMNVTPWLNAHAQLPSQTHPRSLSVP
jgi:hypothetical protein